MLEVWSEAFRVLGVEDPHDTRFDVEFGKKVEQQEEIYEQSFSSDNFNVRLDRPIILEETVGAISRLKLGKAAGSDQVVAEILKRGGERVEHAVYLLCKRAWTEETYRQTGREE